MIKTPLIIGGDEVFSQYFQVRSPFFEGYSSQAANARLTDLAAAIGCARRADRGDLPTRTQALLKTAQHFSYTQMDLEHTVRMTGTPIRVVSALFEEIPRWIREIVNVQRERFEYNAQLLCQLTESLQPNLTKLYTRPEGFCYAVTPGNDPRASLLAAANLAYLGIPFVLRASRKDAVAPLVIKALIRGGFDPNFCSLLYFDSPDAQHKNFKLVEASSVVWTFGPPSLVDRKLRYESVGRRAVIELPHGVESVAGSDLARLAASQEVSIQEVQRDHFEGKTILRHQSGNCAAILRGGLQQGVESTLERAVLFPLGCTDTKSLYLYGAGEGWMADLQDFLQGLVAGDPLDERTQVGFVDPRNLDALQRLVKVNRLRIRAYGGERISRFQAQPLLVASQEDAPDFFGQEVPAYVLAVRECEHAVEAAGWINRYTGSEPRLAVSLLNLGRAEAGEIVPTLKAHSVLLDRPTTQVVPVLHEGNDYALRTNRGKLIVGDW